MMQRKNKPKPTTNEGISIESLLLHPNNHNNNNSNHPTSNGSNNISNNKKDDRPTSPTLDDHRGSSPSKTSKHASSSISNNVNTDNIDIIMGDDSNKDVSNNNNIHNNSIHSNRNDFNNNNNNNNNKHQNNQKQHKKIILAATVKSNTFGTSPFDKHWLNLDCCGIICATLTYMLHAYGVYAFGWILLPPWMGIMSEDGVRTFTYAGYFHRALFITVAIMAVTAHFKAMTTDPGAVPPDANPIPDPDELDSLIKGEGESPVRSSFGATSSSNSSALMQEDSTSEDTNVNGNNNGRGMNINSPGNNSPHQYNKRSNHNHNNIGNGNGVATSGVAMAAMGAAAAVGAAGVVVASAASAAGPIRARPSSVPVTRGKRMCRRCQAYKPPRAHHCSICKRCIIKMDHHCPWVNNCVGIGNHKYFLLFIFYTSLSCVYSLTFLTYRFMHCVSGKARGGPRCVDHPTDLLPLVGLGVEALLFGLFTICMMVDQWDVVMTNLTHIDRLKGAQHYGQTPIFNPHNALAQNILYATRRGINEVFGTGSTSSSVPSRTGFHPTWLSPLHKVCFPESIRDDIFGYCRPCNSSSSMPGSRRRMEVDRVDSMEMAGRGNKRGIGGEEIV